NLRGSVLRGTRFGKAVLRGVKGGAWDAVVTSGMVWDPRGTWLRAPGWRQLREGYTGTRAMFHMVLLVAFMAPLILRTLYWLSINRFQTLLVPLADSTRVSGMTPCLSETCQVTTIWRAVFGVDRGWTVWLPAGALVIYNLIRTYLTWQISPMREEEDLSGVSPALSRYRHLLWLHWIFTILFVYAVVHAGQLILRNLFLPVWLPQ
ncbi:MAG TPA: hypothetical protein VGA78_18090, partial [Gemmatimonadales bacterium]